MSRRLDASKLTFMCRCSPEEEQACDELLAYVKEELGGTGENLVSRIVMDLAWSYHADITGIYADQWFGVTSEAQCRKGEEPEFSTFVQCDMVEDGMAATWAAWREKYGEERKWPKS
jgi:hypothetical protein